jgi:hypothetical protein
MARTSSTAAAARKVFRECRGPIEVVVVRPSLVYRADEPEWPNRVEPAAGERIEYLKALRLEAIPNRFVVAQQRNLSGAAGEESKSSSLRGPKGRCQLNDTAFGASGWSPVDSQKDGQQTQFDNPGGAPC